jgi:hypothetical protein
MRSIEEVLSHFVVCREILEKYIAALAGSGREIDNAGLMDYD